MTTLDLGPRFQDPRLEHLAAVVRVRARRELREMDVTPLCLDALNAYHSLLGPLYFPDPIRSVDPRKYFVADIARVLQIINAKIVGDRVAKKLGA